MALWYCVGGTHVIRVDIQMRVRNVALLYVGLRLFYVGFTRGVATPRVKPTVWPTVWSHQCQGEIYEQGMAEYEWGV